MPIPAVDPKTGLLPPARPGPYAATLAEVKDVFVDHAPNPIERQLIFGALCHWLSVAHQAFGPGLVWVNGGFVTHKAAPPHDVDLVFIPDDLDTARKSLVGGEGYSLLTVQDMFFSIPEPGGHLVRLQPFGGLVDAFLVDPR